MAALLTEKLQPNSQGLYTEFWNDVQIVSDDVLQRVAQLYTQLKVQQKLQTVSKLLQDSYHLKTLPDQTVTRVKFFLQLVFSEERLGKELKNLNCNDSLLLCGLSYTIRELRGLTSPELQFLINHTPEFVKNRGLTAYLHRRDIYDSINRVQEISDKERFDKFLSWYRMRYPQKRKRGFSPHVIYNQGNTPENDGTCTATEEEPSRVKRFENPPSTRMLQVFGDCMSGKIILNMKDGGSVAAIAMDFVYPGLVDCLMSLRIVPSKVEGLVLQLFKVPMERSGAHQYLVLPTDVRLRPNLNALNGVSDDAVLSTFGPGIYAAFRKSEMRMKEIEQGEAVTGCVTMLVPGEVDGEAIIYIVMDLRFGLRIKNELFGAQRAILSVCSR